MRYLNAAPAFRSLSSSVVVGMSMEGLYFGLFASIAAGHVEVNNTVSNS